MKRPYCLIILLVQLIIPHCAATGETGVSFVLDEVSNPKDAPCTTGNVIWTVWKNGELFNQGTCPGGPLTLTAGEKIKGKRCDVSSLPWPGGPYTAKIKWCGAESDTLTYGDVLLKTMAAEEEQEDDEERCSGNDWVCGPIGCGDKRCDAGERCRKDDAHLNTPWGPVYPADCHCVPSNSCEEKPEENRECSYYTRCDYCIQNNCMWCISGDTVECLDPYPTYGGYFLSEHPGKTCYSTTLYPAGCVGIAHQPETCGYFGGFCCGEGKVCKKESKVANRECDQCCDSTSDCVDAIKGSVKVNLEIGDRNGEVIAALSGEDLEEVLTCSLEWGDGIISDNSGNALLLDGTTSLEVTHQYAVTGKAKVVLTCASQKLPQISISASDVIEIPADENPPCKDIYISGDSADKLDLVFLGHGYRDLAEFESRVKEHYEKLLSIPPFSDHKDKFNIRIVNDLFLFGCQPVDTLGASGSGIECDNSFVEQKAAACPHEQIIVLIDTKNVKEFADHGTGNEHLAYVSDNDARISVHEFGHSFGRLTDEYVHEEFSGGDVSAYLNCDAYPCSKWKNVPGTGCIKGCSNREWYRPSEKCIMKSGHETDAFCPVCFNRLNELMEKYK